MTLEIKTIKLFKKNLKRFIHLKLIVQDVDDVIKVLANEQPLEIRYRDHPLIGNWIGYRECHVRGDLVLVYKIAQEENTLYLAAFGSHSEVLKI